MTNYFSSPAFEQLRKIAEQFNRLYSLENIAPALDSLRWTLNSIQSAQLKNAIATVRMLTETGCNYERDSDWIDITDCAETVSTAMEAVLPFASEEQRITLDETHIEEKNGKKYLTFDRIISLISLLITVYSFVHGALQEAEQKEENRRTKELIGNVLEIEQSRNETEMVLFESDNAIINAINELSAILNEAVDFESKETDNEAFDCSDNPPE